MIHDLILQAVEGLPEMKGKKLIHLSIVGSRSKQLASHDSDYDLKAIILHSTENYLLQNVTPNKVFGELHSEQPRFIIIERSYSSRRLVSIDC